jgi:hypothetical protein
LLQKKQGPKNYKKKFQFKSAASPHLFEGGAKGKIGPKIFNKEKSSNFWLKNLDDKKILKGTQIPKPWKNTHGGARGLQKNRVRSKNFWSKNQRNSAHKSSKFSQKKPKVFVKTLFNLIERARNSRRPWIVYGEKTFNRFKSKVRERMQKRLRILLNRKHNEKRFLFKIRLFGRKALSKLYGNLNRRGFKKIYNESIKATFGEKSSLLFLKFILRVDVLTYILHFSPSVEISKEAVKHKMLVISDTRFIYTKYYKPRNFLWQVPVGVALHMHMNQAEAFFIIQFYRSVVKRGFLFTQTIAETSRKILIGVVLPTASLERLFNKKVEKKIFSKW